MKINSFERLMVNNPIRNALMNATFRRFGEWSGTGRALDRVLEIGCGYGEGIRRIDANFSPREIVSFDLDERMVAAAARRTRDVRAKVDLSVGDSERIGFPDEHFDAVFELTIFHHIPDWRAALGEVARVLRPGGIFYFEDLLREFHFDVPVIRFFQSFTDHPWDTIPPKQDFLDALASVGLHLIQVREPWVRSWVVGAARKPD
ncbi:MAG: methyltransferase domain-containing protein [Deltaproteobacteria bacterium]|nr:methyltransferase domain-containing protein [Deltaproteobacteria bacterium]